METVLYENGQILTMDDTVPFAQAMAIEGERLVAVGKTEDLRKKYPEAIRKDLVGRMVVPGLIDGHAHPTMVAAQLGMVNTPRFENLEALRAWIVKERDTKPKGEWIYIHRIFPSRLAEFRYLNLAELDALCPDHPVFLNGAFAGQVNSCALQVSGITSKTNHSGIIKDEAGSLTGGVLRSAMGLLNFTPSALLSGEPLKEAVLSVLKGYSALGITGCTETLSTEQEWELFVALKKEGKLPIRLHFNFCPGHPKSGEELCELLQPFPFRSSGGDEWMRIGPLKVFVDGGILTATSLMNEPWGEPGSKLFGGGKKDYCGVKAYDTQIQLTEVVRAARELGWNFTAHCTGDGAVKMLLNAYETLDKEKPIYDERFQILHANLLSTTDLERCQEMGILIDMQPAWLTRDLDALLHFLGEARMKYFLPTCSALDKDLRLCSGSDHMSGSDPDLSTNPFNPWLGIHALCTRKSDKGTLHRPDQRLSRLEALQTYTINNAYKSGEESQKGSLTVGKLADFAVLDLNFMECSDDDIPKIRPVATFVGGKCVMGSVGK